jgi:hypothetical protein
VTVPAAQVCRGIRRLAFAKNDQVTLFGQATGSDSKRKMPMTLVLVMIFNILVALALGFVLGRIYQIRRDELERRDGFTAYLRIGAGSMITDSALTSTGTGTG